MNKFNVDIIMGVYNCEKYLKKCFDSLLAQTYKKWRIILCDDGSNDNSYNIMIDYQNKYPEQFIVLKNKKNMGLNFTLNKCLDYSTSKYIARLDADDYCEITRLEKEIDFLEKNPAYSFVSCNAILFDENGQWGELKYKEIPDAKDFVKISPFCHAAVIIRRDAFIDVGGYTVDDKLLRVEDYHLWFKLYSKGYKGYNIQEFLYFYRDDQNASRRRTWKNRLNEYYVRKIGYKMIGVPIYLRIYKYRPLILGLIPQPLYLILHKSKLKK